MKILLILLITSVVSFAQPKLLIREDFSGNMRNWQEDEHKSIVDGNLLLNTGEDGDQSFISTFIDGTKDFTIEAEFIQKSGLSDGGFGIVWGADDVHYNVFLISSDQHYAVYSGDIVQLKKWKTSPLIKPLGETNQLKIEYIGGKIIFYINNSKLDEEKPFTSYGSWLGVLALSQMQLSLDNLLVFQDQTIALPEKVQSFANKENLGSGVNSEEDDIGPVISSDGKLLYFARQNVKENIGGIYDDEDIYTSQWQKDAWTRAVNMGRSVNTGLADNLVAVSADNNTMVFEKDNSLAVRHRTTAGWSEFQKLELAFKNESDYFVASVSADGKTIIFSAKLKQNILYDPRRQEGDLYVSIKDKNGKWSSPINLGASINTLGDETSPFISADGKTLYFATDGRPGYGYQDIFFSRRIGESWTQWSAPLNLGPSVNSPGFDAYYTVPAAGDYAYFVSYGKGFGKGDIFRIKLHEDIKPDPVILVKGIVMNNSSKMALGATIHFEDLSNGAEVGEARSDPKTGLYQIILPFGFHYGVRAKLNGFYAVNENLELQENAKYREVTKDLLLVPIEIGETMKLNNVFFNAGLAVLKDLSFPELDRLVTILRENPGIHIELAGHTDAKGNAEVLMNLSRDRVDAVKAYLVTKGIGAERISGQGYGATKPIASSDTEENSMLNRRVEFKITKK